MPETVSAIARALSGMTSSAANMFKPKLPESAKKPEKGALEAMSKVS